MSIELIATIKPKNNGNFPIVEDTDLKGSYRVVADVAGLNAIPDERKRAGMMVYQQDVNKLWKLDDSDSWGEVIFAHTIVVNGAFMPQESILYFKGVGGEDEPIDQSTILTFPQQCTTAERIALGNTFPGRVVFDTDLVRLATYDGVAWRLS